MEEISFVKAMPKNGGDVFDFCVSVLEVYQKNKKEKKKKKKKLSQVFFGVGLTEKKKTYFAILRYIAKHKKHKKNTKNTKKEEKKKREQHPASVVGRPPRSFFQHILFKAKRKCPYKSH